MLVLKKKKVYISETIPAEIFHFQGLNQSQTKLFKREIISQSIIVIVSIVWLIQTAEKMKKSQYMTRSITSHHVTLKWDRM
jgi:hypothetical protein